jgi:SNF2 family DNA or RNA helicase
LSKVLYPHQRRIIKWMRDNERGGIFVEMRLGKTLATIRRLKWANPKRTLIVAPSSAIGSWVDEYEDEGMDDPSLLLGTYSQRKKELDRGNPICIINQFGWLALPEITKAKFDAVVIDESSFIKNPFTKITEFYTENFRDAQFRYCLTGTPNPESRDDFFPQICFAKGNFLGYECKKYWDYKYALFRVNAKMRWMSFPRRGTQERVIKEIADNSIIIRRKDAGLDRKKIRTIRRIEFDGSIRNTYNLLLNDFILRLEGRPDERLLWKTTQFIRLWQLCAGVDPDGNLIWRGKLYELISLLEGELKDKQVVVWFQFRASITHASAELRKFSITHGVMTGGQTYGEREEIRKLFKEGKYRILLMQESVGRTGMNLSVADVAIYYTAPISMTAKTQTEDRILSLNKNGPLLYIHLTVKDSIEEHILKRVKDKKFESRQDLETAIRYIAKDSKGAMKRYVKKR